MMLVTDLGKICNSVMVILFCKTQNINIMACAVTFFSLHLMVVINKTTRARYIKEMLNISAHSNYNHGDNAKF
jgi:hypothetical protein